MKVISKILYFVLIPVAIYFSIATVLIMIGKPKTPDSAQRGPAFDELFIDYSRLPELKSYTARDGTRLGYRYYPADSEKIVILLHGAAWHSQYFVPLAQFISSEGLAQVYTPDLRGHGPSPERRGDVDFIGQLEDDMADLISMIRKDNPKGMLIVGGHSSGGGLAIRFAGSHYGQQADAFVLMAPRLQYNAPTTRPGSGGFANSNTLRFAGIAMLNNVGIHWFDDLTTVEFNMPEKARDGTETLSYSYRLTMAYEPHNYKKDLRAITQPFFVVAGTADETYFAQKYETVISQYTDVQVELLQDVTHFGLVVGLEVRPVIRNWLEDLGKL